MGHIILFKYKKNNEFVVVFTKRTGVTLFCLQSKAVAKFEYSSTLMCNNSKKSEFLFIITKKNVILSLCIH